VTNRGAQLVPLGIPIMFEYTSAKLDKYVVNQKCGRIMNDPINKINFYLNEFNLKR
jgi:hypothetical protein